jgi:hypothetical protein
MSIDRIVEQIPQSADAAPKALPLERGPGNFLLFVSSLANVNVTLIYDGVRETFTGINGSFIIRRVKPWQNLRIDGPIGTVVTYYYGTEDVDRDETDIRQNVAVLAGVSATADQPANTVASTAPVVTAAGGANHQLFPQNLARRRMTVFLDPNSPCTVYLRTTGGANNIAYIQPGQYLQFTGFYGIDYSDTLLAAAGGNTFYLFEET